MNPQYIQFFTATILWWKKLLKPDKYKQLIVESMRFLAKDGRVKIYGPANQVRSAKASPSGFIDL